jgi:hypothetical protein
MFLICIAQVLLAGFCWHRERLRRSRGRERRRRGEVCVSDRQTPEPHVIRSLDALQADPAGDAGDAVDAVGAIGAIGAVGASGKRLTAPEA